MDSMETLSRDQIPLRRTSEPHHHTQPRYAEYRPRRHTDGGQLRKMHSRPEDYKNKPKPDKLVEYICFDVDEPPKKNNRATEPPLNRLNSNSSNTTVATDDSGYDSEDELTLPPTFHHDLCHKDEGCWKYQSKDHHNPSRVRESPDRHSRRRSGRDTDPAAQHHHRHHHHSSQDEADTPRRTSAPRRESPSSSSSHSRSRHASMSEHEENLVAKVADHLKRHKNAYSSHNSSEVVNELLSEVMRKVADGGLDGNLMKEVVREVQHVL